MLGSVILNAKTRTTLSPMLARLSQLIKKNATTNGITETALDNVLVYRESQSFGRVPLVYEPAIFIAAQGKKNIYLEGQKFQYGAGSFLALFMPMALECELVDINEQHPMLGVAIRLDRQRLTRLLLKMESLDQMPPRPEKINSSGIFSAPLNHALLDATIRLLKTLDDVTEANIIGESVIDEIYYRILSDQQGGALKILLRQQGQIQQISKAIDYMHKHLNQSVSMENLAQQVSMSSSGFYKKFKQVMHVSPLQYIKLIRLNRANDYIMQGNSISQAAYRVGYNSPAQFSREYKRQFGVPPSSVSVSQTQLS